LIDNLGEALDQFQLKTSMQRLDDLHKEGAMLARVFRDQNGAKYAVTFKRDWYKNFGFHFKQQGAKGWGQITSLVLLNYCQENNIKYLVAVMPQGIAYFIEAAAFLKYYKDYATDVTHLKGEVACPIAMWKRLYP